MVRNKRRTLTSGDHEKRRQRGVLIFTFFMIFLMVFSFASVILYNPTSDYQMQYGEYEFELEQRANGGSVLVTQINDQTIEFQNLPVQVAHIPVDPTAISLLTGAQQIALTADPNLSIQEASLVDYARLQLVLALPSAFNAMTKPVEGLALPVLNCTHASAQMPIVLFNLTNETGSVTTDGSCILLNGNNQDLMRLKDRIIFEYYGMLRNGEIVE